MKTKSVGKRFLGGAWAGLFLFALGCSDGVLPTQGPANPELTPPPPPEVVSFMANPTLVDNGGSSVLSWEVTGADKVEITSSSVKNKFNFSTTEAFKSSTVAENIQEDTTFILTATKMPAAAETPAVAPAAKQTPAAPGTTPGTAPSTTPETKKPDEATGPQPAVTTAQVTVKVRGSKLTIVRFDATTGAALGEDGNYHKTGADVVLQWSVVPTGATVSLSASTGDPVVAGDCLAATTKAMELDATAPAEYPTEGCATVHPTQNTVYTLNAELDGKIETKKLTVNVDQGLKIEYFTATGSVGGTVNLSWKAAPSNATVTITSVPMITSLPTDSSQVEGTWSGTVATDTVFTLTVKLGEEEQTAQAEIKSNAMTMDCSKFSVTSDVGSSPAFSGEKITVRWSVANIPAFVKSVVVMEGATQVAGPADVKAGSVEVKVTGSAYTVVFKSETADVCPQSLAVPVATLESVNEKTALRVVKDTMNPKGVYVGGDLGGYNGGKIQVAQYTPAAKTMDIDYVSTLKPYDDVTKLLNPAFLEKAIGTFPVNAVAVGKEGRLFVATTGAVLYKEGPGWKVLSPLLRVARSAGESGTHDTCFGKKQRGRQASLKGEIIGMGQVCDMAMSGDGKKLFVATDRGMFSLDDVEAYIKDYKSQKWNGKETGNTLYGSVVNDVEVVGDKVYAAGAKGAYVSTDGGTTWNPVGEGISGEAYSVAATSNAVAVGTGDGLYISLEGKAQKVESVSGKVYSVSFADGVLYAGTDAGLYVSRDGNTFTKIAISAEGNPVIRSVLGFRSENDYYVYVATETGLWKAYVKMPAAVTPAVQPTPAGETVTDGAASGEVSAE